MSLGPVGAEGGQNLGHVAGSGNTLDGVVFFSPIHLESNHLIAQLGP